MDKTFSKILSDTKMQNPVPEQEWEMASEHIMPDEDHRWSVHYYPLHGGKQEGVWMLNLDNGKMALSVVPSRGMNIFSAHCEGIRLGWDSPVQEIVHPQWVQPESRGGMGWLEGFNEMFCRCGLENTGAPCTDSWEDENGHNQLFLPLHGRVSNTPASKLWFRCEKEPPYRLIIGGEVRIARVFGPCYLLRTEISTLPGSAEFMIEDEVVNLGGAPCEFELLYHCNFGTPVLNPGGRIAAPVKKISARDDRALGGIRDWDTIGHPQEGFEEQCYFLKLHADPQSGNSTVALVEPDNRFAVKMGFPLEKLPAFTLWKYTASQREGYVIGLEPGTGYANTRTFERERGRVLQLGPQKSYRTNLSIGLEKGMENVKSLCDKIENISNEKPEVGEFLDPELTSV